MARTWRSSRPQAEGSAPNALADKNATTSPNRTRKPPEVHRTPPTQSSEDGFFSKDFYEGLAHRWGVTVDEFDYQEDKPRTWLYNLRRDDIQYDERSLSPWALAYYDRYPDEMDEVTRHYYERDRNQPRVERFMDTKEVTCLVKGNDGDFVLAAEWKEAPEEPKDDASGPSHWYRREPKLWSNWIETSKRPPKTTGPQRSLSPARPYHNTDGLQVPDHHQSQATKELSSESFGAGDERPEYGEAFVADADIEGIDSQFAMGNNYPMDPADRFGGDFDAFADLRGDGLEEGDQNHPEDNSGGNVNINPGGNVNINPPDGVEENPQVISDDSPSGSLEDNAMLGDMSQADADRMLKTYREALERIRSHHLKESRDSLWRSFSPDTRTNYEAELPLADTGLPELGNNPAEEISLADAMAARKIHEDYLREHMPKLPDKKQGPEQARGADPPRRSTRRRRSGTPGSP